MPIDYETLRVIWWALIGVLLIGFAVMDGFDLGMAICLPFLGKTDNEKNILINCVAPTWEGNQVWFILGGGAIFAAWPTLYAVSFSGFYLAMLLVLLALILRPVGFKYRSKIQNTLWRNGWDVALFIGGFVPSLVFGVAIGNVLQGVPFYFDDSLRVFYTGTFLQLLNPFALACGFLSVCMLSMHGAFFIQVKTEGSLQFKAGEFARTAALVALILFVVLGIWTYWGIDGYLLNSIIYHDGPSNPLHKNIITQTGAWYHNYLQYPFLILFPIGGISCMFLAIIFARKAIFAFMLSACAVAAIIATFGVSMFPFLLPSSTQPNQSLLVWDSSSSQTTLFIMLIATVILLPIILLYTAWVYRVLRGKVTIQAISDFNSGY